MLTQLPTRVDAARRPRRHTPALLLLKVFVLSAALLFLQTTLNTIEVKAAPNVVTWPPVVLLPLESGFTRSIDVVSANDGTDRLFVIEQGGIIYIIENGERLATPFLDISARASDPVDPCHECGLLGLAFPPDFAENGYFFVNYTSAVDLVGPDAGDADPTTVGDIVIARFHLTANPNIADPNSEEPILTVNKPSPIHNGGHIFFGPDDYLYIGTGDGGGVSRVNAQDPTSLLGKILRIQVSEVATYTIPVDNPFIDVTDYRDEIWAMGLRNPWRFSIDRASGDLYVADVGEAMHEEVNSIAAADVGNGGMNFGWPILEGNVCFPTNGPQDCDRTGLTMPVITYGHSAGNCSVTGGYVYDYAYNHDGSSQAPVYLYGDLCSGRVWGLQRDGVNWASTELGDFSFSISSFGEDENRGIYVVSLAGTIYQIEGSIPVTITELSASNNSPTQAGSVTSFTATVSSGTHISYTWDFGDNSSGTGKTTSHTYAAAGTYTATVVASNTTNSMTATTLVFVTEVIPPITDLAAQNSSPSELGSATTFTATTSSGTHISYTWDFGDNSSGTGMTTSHTYAAAGTYTATVVATNTTNSQIATTLVSVTAVIPPITDLAAQNSSPAELGSATTFSATTSGGTPIAYTWNFGDGSNGAGATPTHSYSQTGIYTATVVASNAINSMTSTTTVYVGDQVVKVTNNQYTPNNFTIEEGETVIWQLVEGNHSVTADDGSFEQPLGSAWPPFVQSFPSATTFSAAAINDTIITYHCSLHQSLGMTATFTIVGAGTEAPPAVAGLNAANDGPKQVNQAIGLTATITGGTEISYAWAFGDGSSGNGATITHAYAPAGIYTATITASNATNSMTATTTVYVGDAVVEVADFDFTPRAITLPVGSTVVWVLRNGTHSVTADDNSFAQAEGSDWAPFVQTFDRPSVNPYYCIPHGEVGGGGMAGVVTVGEQQQPRLLLPSVKLKATSP